MKKQARKITSKLSSMRVVARKEKQHARRITDTSSKRRMKQINKEFRAAFKFLQKNPDTVTIFGSARLADDSKYSILAEKIAEKIVREVGSAVVTGGGQGIMAAGNRGAHQANGTSLGMTIHLPFEQVTNPYVNYSVDFYYFFSRKVALTFTARAYICFPGGFGTMDEFFEVLTLKQTHRIDQIPIILVGKDFWTPLLKFIDNTLLDKYGVIGKGDNKLYHLTDDPDEVIRLLKKPLVRNHK